jgi:hypothetical protein
LIWTQCSAGILAMNMMIMPNIMLLQVICSRGNFLVTFCIAALPRWLPPYMVSNKITVIVLMKFSLYVPLQSAIFFVVWLWASSWCHLIKLRICCCGHCLVVVWVPSFYYHDLLAMRSN